MNSSVLLLLAVLVPAAVGMWLLHWAKRLVAWLFAIVAALLVVGVGTWRDSLASVVVTRDALAVLLAVDVISVFVLIIHAFKKDTHKRHYHHVWTHAVALVAGTALALTITDGIVFLRQLRHAPAGTASAIGQAVTQVNSGRAAHAIPHHTAMTVLTVAGAILITLIILAYRKHSGGSATRTPAAATGAARAALPQGGQGGGSFPVSGQAGNVPARRGGR